MLFGRIKEFISSAICIVDGRSTFHTFCENNHIIVYPQVEEEKEKEEEEEEGVGDDSDYSPALAKLMRPDDEDDPQEVGSSGVASVGASSCCPSEPEAGLGQRGEKLEEGLVVGELQESLSSSLAGDTTGLILAQEAGPLAATAELQVCFQTERVKVFIFSSTFS